MEEMKFLKRFSGMYNNEICDCEKCPFIHQKMNMAKHVFIYEDRTRKKRKKWWRKIVGLIDLVRVFRTSAEGKTTILTADRIREITGILQHQANDELQKAMAYHKGYMQAYTDFARAVRSELHEGSEK